MTSSRLWTVLAAAGLLWSALLIGLFIYGAGGIGARPRPSDVALALLALAGGLAVAWPTSPRWLLPFAAGIGTIVAAWAVIAIAESTPAFFFAPALTFVAGALALLGSLAAVAARR
jgi:hypothetical protein